MNGFMQMTPAQMTATFVGAGFTLYVVWKLIRFVHPFIRDHIFRQGHDEGIAEGIRIGMEKGKKEGRREAEEQELREDFDKLAELLKELRADMKADHRTLSGKLDAFTERIVMVESKVGDLDGKARGHDRRLQLLETASSATPSNGKE